MSMFPPIEARVSAQERRQIHLDARIEEVTEEVTASFKHLSEYFNKIEDRLEKFEATMATKEDIAEIKRTMATKEDIAAMENRILETFKQILTTLNPQ